MWWLTLNAMPVSTLILATTMLPHYTITFRFIFEFLVLGVVPGTNYEVNFLDALIIALVVMLLILLVRLGRVAKNQRLTTS